MNVQSFIAPTAREALARIRHTLGDDAVVLSTRPHSAGVEVLASAYASLDLQTGEREPEAVGQGSRILKEIAHLRALLQNQLAGFAWSANRRRDPIRAALLQTLFAAGFGSALARPLAARLPRNLNPEAAQTWLRQILIRNLAIIPPADDVLLQHRMLALVGPTGAGKTTTLAKLAERGVRRHGAEHVAIVCGDAYRIGAATQLQIYAELLGVALHIVKDPSEYAATLRSLGDKKLILIDTAGFNPHDARVAQMQAVQRGHAPADRALPGKHHTPGTTNDVGVGREPHRNSGRHMFDGLHHRAQVTHAVIDDRNGVHILIFAATTQRRKENPKSLRKNRRRISWRLRVFAAGTITNFLLWMAPRRPCAHPPPAPCAAPVRRP